MSASLKINDVFRFDDEYWRVIASNSAGVRLTIERASVLESRRVQDTRQCKNCHRLFRGRADAIWCSAACMKRARGAKAKGEKK